MSGEETAKLKTLLNYWIVHNREHSQEFREWADKVKALGASKANKDMLQAVKEMDKASEYLLRALRDLE